MKKLGHGSLAHRQEGSPRAAAAVRALLAIAAPATLAAASTVYVACSSSSSDAGGPDASLGDGDAVLADGAAGDDGGTVDGASGTDAQEDANLATVTEQEPNNGSSAADTQAVAFPARVTGAIDPADDTDVFKADLTAGELWTWTLDAKGSSLAPHLSISEDGNKVPAMVSPGAAGGAAGQEHFVLESAAYYVIARDARNVPSASSQHMGGPAFGYELTGRRTPRAPMAATFPSTVQGSLGGKNKIALYSFSFSTQTGFDVDLKAKRKMPASNMDSQMSLFDATQKKWVITNDDLSGSTTDSHVGGTSPAGDFVLVVENVDPAATDLSFELDFTLR